MRIRNILFGAFVASLMLPVGVAEASATPQIKVTASLDSAYILMGRQTVLHVETLSPADLAKPQLLVPDDTLVKNVEVIRHAVSDSSVSNGLMSIRHDIVIQSFDSGLYALPPMQVLVGNDTFLSNHSVLKVVPVNVDSLNGRIHDFADVQDPDRHFLDFIPQGVFNWLGWSLLAFALIAAVLYTMYYIRKRRKNPIVRQKKIVPPYEEAMQALTALHDEKLCDKGQEREFYTRLTDILRNYLYRRFGISAMEMTSTEILRSLNNNSETRLTRKQMEDVLSMADFVKFAKMRPLPADNIRTYNNAVEFVENTRPVPETAPDEKAKSTEGTSKP